MATAVVLGANPFRGQTITPVDILVSQRAWAFVDPGVHVRNYHRSDILNGLIPTWTVARKQLRSGHMPMWDDKVAGGGSLLTVSSDLFTPAFLIFAGAPSETLGFYLAVLFNLTVAGLGMHLFLRRRLGLAASVVGALSFEFCGFNAGWLYWPHVLTLIWAPWLLWSIDRCSDEHRRAKGFALAAATALAALGGFPFLSVLVLETGALYALAIWISRLRSGQDPWRPAAWYVAGTLLGLLIAAIPLLGLVHWLHQFDIGYRYGRGSYLDLHDWKQLFPPWAWDTRNVEQTMYVGVVMLALALSAVAAAVIRWRRTTVLSWFAIALSLVAAGLVFGVWPMWLIGWLPGMAYNSWSRAIGIMDLAFIILGAMAIDACVQWARRRRWRRILYVGVAVLVLIQVGEVAVLFRAWNGPVSSRDYYPAVPSIGFMQEHAGPFDYVITDKSFLMSGTLGTYGLREWLAHYFRSPALQRALHEMARHPFHTHVASASRFPADDVRYRSTAMADFNVRFVAIDASKTPVSAPPIALVRAGKNVPLPSMPEHTYVQWFTIKGHPISASGISVRLATYLEANLPGTVKLSLHDAKGGVIATGTSKAANAADNTYLYLAFPKPVRLRPGRYRFDMRYSRPETSRLRLGAWAFAVPTPGASLRIDGEPYAGNIDFRIEVASDGPFRRTFASGGTAVLENTHSPKGPYFLRSITDHANSRSARNVRVIRYRAANFALAYSGTSAGFVIVPMTGNADWQVHVNGKRIDYALKKGVMPAIPVSGPADVVFDYRPPAASWWIPWLIAVMLGIVAMGWFEYRSQ